MNRLVVIALNNPPLREFFSDCGQDTHMNPTPHKSQLIGINAADIGIAESPASEQPLYRANFIERVRHGF